MFSKAESFKETLPSALSLMSRGWKSLCAYCCSPSSAGVAKIARIKAIADRYGISMKAAGLQFALANPAGAAVIPGASQPGRVAEDRAALLEVVPADFWRELRDAGLVSAVAPLPGR